MSTRRGPSGELQLHRRIRGHVNALAEQIAAADAKHRRQQDLSQSSAFNEFLNHWKNKFTPERTGTLFGGLGEGGGFGGTGSAHRRSCCPARTPTRWIRWQGQ